MKERGAIDVVNQDRFAWTDVHVEVGEGYESFRCPAVPSIGSGHSLTVLTSSCRSPDQHVPMHVCVVRVTAKEGGIVSALEPCLPVQ
jgi:hypothetical protein